MRSIAICRQCLAQATLAKKNQTLHDILDFIYFYTCSISNFMNEKVRYIVCKHRFNIVHFGNIQPRYEYVETDVSIAFAYKTVA